MSSDEREEQTDRRISVPSVVMWILYRSVMVKRELSEN